MLERVKGKIEATGHVESRGVTITKRLMELSNDIDQNTSVGDVRSSGFFERVK